MVAEISIQEGVGAAALLKPPTCGRVKGKLASAASARRLRRPLTPVLVGGGWHLGPRCQGIAAWVIDEVRSSSRLARAMPLLKCSFENSIISQKLAVAASIEAYRLLQALGPPANALECLVALPRARSACSGDPLNLMETRIDHVQAYVVGRGWLMAC